MSSSHLRKPSGEVSEVGEVSGRVGVLKPQGERITTMMLGSLVYVRYMDHVLFKDVNPSLYLPWSRETIGWLDYEDDECLRLVWERFAMPDPPNEAKPRATGLAILKKAVSVIRKIV